MDGWHVRILVKLSSAVRLLACGSPGDKRYKETLLRKTFEPGDMRGGFEIQSEGFDPPMPHMFFDTLYDGDEIVEKRRYSIAFFLIVMVILGMANSASADDGQYTYRYSMQIYNIDGEFLPTPAVPIQLIKKGIRLQITNGLKQTDRFSLLCVLNGDAQYFSTNKVSNVKQAFYEIDGKKTMDISLHIELKNLRIEGDNILHIITIGLLDKIPKNEFDHISTYSHTVSIPLDTGNMVKNAPAISYTTPNMQYDPIRNNGLKKVSFIPDNEEINSCLQLIYKADNNHFPLDVAIYPYDGPICVLFFLDGELLPLDGNDSIIMHKDESHFFRCSYNLQLAQGVHQVFAIWLPMDGSLPAVFSTSEKIVIQVNETELRGEKDA